MKQKIGLLLFILTFSVFAEPQLKINNKVVKNGISITEDQWSYAQKFSLLLPAPEHAPLMLESHKYKKHQSIEDLRGYNGDILLKIKAPGPVTAIEAQALIMNYGDATKRKIGLQYSLNGVDFITLEEKSFQAGACKLTGTLQDITKNNGTLWLRFQRFYDAKDSNGLHGFIVWKEISIKLDGKVDAPAVPIAATANMSALSDNNSLKIAFPRGVFWAWERTAANAKNSGLEYWDYVDKTMALLKENHYDTIWSVNLTSGNMLKVLNLAQKNGLKVLLNSDLLEIFYADAQSLDRLEKLAETTVARISDHPALKGYILKDEPLLSDLGVINYLYHLMKKYDPAHESVSVVMNRQSMTYLRESEMSIICSDIYYFSHDKSTHLPSPVTVSMREFTNALDSFNTAAELYGKNSWFMGQMFGDVWGRHWRKGDKFVVSPGSYLHWRMPTVAETRWQIWEAVRLGSKGIFFYILLPTIPLDVPPEQATTAKQNAMIAEMDSLAKTAKSWKNQPLTEKELEIDYGSGMLLPDGAPTKQMTASADVMKVLAKNESILAGKKRAAFPVFFAGDKQTSVATFEAGDEKRYGVIVNRNLNENRKIEVLLPLNVTEITDLGSDEKLPISSFNSSFNKIDLELLPGDGLLLAADFEKQAGITFYREKFDDRSVHLVDIGANAIVIHHGSFGADANRSLQLKSGGNSSLPVCSISGLDKRKATKMKNGLFYCMIKGNLTNNVTIKAVMTSDDGEKSNVMHLKIGDTAGTKSTEKGVTIQAEEYNVPCVIPPGTNKLEFYLNNPNDYISEIMIWFVPMPKAKGE